MEPLQALQQTARRAALAAGEAITSRYDKPSQVVEKAPQDLVTDADTAAQRAAIAAIRSDYPDDRILAEEDPGLQPDPSGTWQIPPGVTWIIDPLDGTTNFATRLPFICTSVGVAIDGEPVAGAIFDPVRRELIEGVRGAGATINGEPIVPLAPLTLYQSVAAVDWARAPGLTYSVRDVIFAIGPKVRSTRVLGSAVLALAYVALGRVQVYANVGLKPWDAAAAAVVIREAGGDLRTPDGAPWGLGSPTLIAGHPTLLDEVTAAFVNQQSR